MFICAKLDGKFKNEPLHESTYLLYKSDLALGPRSTKTRMVARSYQETSKNKQTKTKNVTKQIFPVNQETQYENEIYCLLPEKNDFKYFSHTLCTCLHARFFGKIPEREIGQ